MSAALIETAAIGGLAVLVAQKLLGRRDEGEGEAIEDAGFPSYVLENQAIDGHYTPIQVHRVWRSHIPAIQEAAMTLPPAQAMWATKHIQEVQSRELAQRMADSRGYARHVYGTGVQRYQNAGTYWFRQFQ